MGALVGGPGCFPFDRGAYPPRSDSVHLDPAVFGVRILVSGSCDLLLTVKGRNLQEVAHFVAAKLATIDGVMSTSTAFMLRKYKESGRIMEDDEEYERLKICF